MSLVTKSSQLDRVAKFERQYRSKQELALRNMVEIWGRSKWPQARCVHELVMGRGAVRADMAFVSRDHLVAIEIKSEYDDTSRLLLQGGMFRLAVPELWIVSANKHIDDADLIRYLIPSVGISLPDRESLAGTFDAQTKLIENKPATQFIPHPEALLSLLWVDELLCEATIRRVYAKQRRGPTHAALVAALRTLSAEECLAAVCRQLRGRDAFWRADPPIRD